MQLKFEPVMKRRETDVGGADNQNEKWQKSVNLTNVLHCLQVLYTKKLKDLQLFKLLIHFI